jgi:hypothetical protein
MQRTRLACVILEYMHTTKKYLLQEVWDNNLCRDMILRVPVDTRPGCDVAATVRHVSCKQGVARSVIVHT